MIYLASPYSHELPYVRKGRFNAANRAAAELMAAGYQVFSPTSHTHPIAEAGGLPLGWDFWKEYDRWFIERCDLVLVLMIDGWQESKGIKAEIALAKRFGKPVIKAAPDKVVDAARLHKVV